MLRHLFLWLSERQAIVRLARRNGAARRFARRFVAGETLDDAVATSRELNQRGRMVSLDLLGESVGNEEETHAARDAIIGTLEAIRARQIDGNVSIKLTQLGLDIGPDVCLANVCTILARARELDVFVRIDMESSAYTERTLSLFHDVLHPEFGGGVGVVIQSYLRRSAAAIERLIEVGARVRLCKGAYAEPPEAAFQTREEVDRSYVALMEKLLDRGNYPGLATHDERLIERALAYVEQHDIPAERFEFQMLYGVRRDLQDRLVRDGYNVRVYIPFGVAWYPYLMRRLAERPANVASLGYSLAKERFGRR